MMNFRKYAVFLLPLIGFSIGLMGGAFSISVLRLIGRLPSPLQERILVCIFGVGGFALALLELIAQIRFYRRHNSKREQ